MSKTWTLKDPKEMPASSEADVQKYGRAYWSYTYDSDMALMFNLMEGAVGDGARITAEEWVNKESAKGTEYLRLRKVKVLSGGEPKPAQTGSVGVTDDNQKLLQLIYEDTQEILRLLSVTAPPKSLKDEWAQTKKHEDTVEDTVVDVDADETINLDQIPF